MQTPVPYILPLTNYGTGASSLTCAKSASATSFFASDLSSSPTGGIAFAILWFFLNLNPHHGKSLREHLAEFDFLGLALIVGGVVLILIGFNFSETSCKSESAPSPSHNYLSARACQ